MPEVAFMLMLLVLLLFPKGEEKIVGNLFFQLREEVLSKECEKRTPARESGADISPGYELSKFCLARQFCSFDKDQKSLEILV